MVPTLLSHLKMFLTIGPDSLALATVALPMLIGCYKTNTDLILHELQKNRRSQRQTNRKPDPQLWTNGKTSLPE
jgi:hypothetical protein